MRIVEEGENCKVIVPEDMDDIVSLSLLIKEGDLVEGICFRRQERKGDEIRKKKSERIPMIVKVRVEKVEVQEYSERLRIHGVIVEGPENVVNSYQTLNFQCGDEIKICKDWEEEDLEYLKEIVEESSLPSCIAVGIEHGSIEIFSIKRSSFERIYSKEWSGGKDIGMENMREVFGEVLSKLEEVAKDKYIIIYGPGFIKEDFIKFLKERNPDMRVEAINTNHGGIRGIYELLKGKISPILKKYRIAKETHLVERLMEEIGREGLYAYGIDEIRKYAESGGIECLLVLENKFHEEDVRKIMKMVKESRGKIHVISAGHEGGKILKSLGGIAAITRFRI